MEIAEQKNILRNQFKQKIQEFISTEDQDLISEGFQKNITNLFSEIQSPSTIGVYAPLKDEVDWSPVLNINDLKLGYPVIDKKEKTFEFYTVSETEKNEIGISLSEEQKGEAVEPEVLFIPGLAFDEKGYRLGRGGGYYDRFLENYKGIKIGLVYSCSFNGELPRMDHDKPVDYIVTEKALFSCKAQVVEE